MFVLWLSLFFAQTPMEPKIVVEYHLRGTVKERFDAEVCYANGQWKLVPIINGVAPTIIEKTNEDGSWFIRYNYISGTPYERCVKRDPPSLSKPPSLMKKPSEIR